MISSKLVITLQHFFLAADLVINCVFSTCNIDSVVLLVLFLAQDLMLIFAVILTFIGLLAKFQYQFGGSQFNTRGFIPLVLVFLEYITLTVTFQTLILQLRWEQPSEMEWTDGLIALYALHRASSFVYYFSYNKSMLLLLGA